MNELPLKEAWIRTRAARSGSLLAEALHAVFSEHRPADRFLRQVFRQDRRIGGRDRRLYSDLIFAVFRWYGPLAKYSSVPAFLLAGAAAAERIDDPAVAFFLADAGLDALRKDELFEAETAVGRLNAFLRLAGISAEVRESDCIPEWILSHLDFTPDAEFFHLQQTRPPLWLRIQDRNPEDVIASLRGNGLDPVAHPRLKQALALPEAKVNLPALEAYKRGRIEVQDLSSQCIGIACAPEPGQRWWDACAGGGGKSLLLASLMHGKGIITASDVRENKFEEIRQRAKRAGFSNIRTRLWDGGPELPVPENSCGGVLVDAPCSSSGRWRRNPESRWTLTEERVNELASLQKTILESAAKAVKPGGVLVYATCSLFREENRLNAEHFLAAHPEFEPERFPHPLTGGSVPGFVQILPQDGDCDASFIARFRKKG